MRIGRFDLAQSSRDHQQAVRVFGHLPQASDKHRTLDGEGAHQIREILALDNADVLKSRNRVVAQFQCPMFHSTEPALEAREVEWILLAGIPYGKKTHLRFRGRGVYPTEGSCRFPLIVLQQTTQSLLATHDSTIPARPSIRQGEQQSVLLALVLALLVVMAHILLQGSA